MKQSFSLLLGLTASFLVFSQSIYAAELSPAQEGRKLFLRLNCYGCHGMGGEGGMGPRLKGKANLVADAVTDGRPGGMRSFHDYLVDNDADKLAAYVETLGTPDEPKFLHWWEDVPSE